MTGKTSNNYFLLQAENNSWSNKCLLQTCEKLSPADYFKEREAFFGSIHATLVHIAHIDQFYISLLKQRQIKDECFPKLDNSSSYQAYQYQKDKELIKYITELSDEELKLKVSIPLNGSHVQVTRFHVLIHLSNHQIHHRGQVHNMLLQTPVKPPQLDEFYF